MEWPLAVLLIFGSLVILMASGMPVAFCFMVVNLIGMFVFWGEAGLYQLILSLRESVTTFTLMPIVMFILMGEVLFQSGMAPDLLQAIDQWLGRLPGRLSLLAVAGGTVFGSLTGSSLASTALLGTVLVPEMEKRGYKKSMILGPVLASGTLAIMIPPSSMAVLVGALGLISIGKILIAIIIPGLVAATFFATYIIVRCWLQPSLAPPHKGAPVPLSEKIKSTLGQMVPVGVIVFLVIGVIILGIATPSEAAASGAIGTFIVSAFHRKLTWEMTKKAILGTLKLTVMIFMIIVGAKAFGQILAFTGASRGLIEFSAGLPLSPIFIIVAMQLVLLFLGMFMSVVAIMMITLPIFVPVTLALGFNLVWFATIYLLNMEIACISPPFGLNLFVLKQVSPPDTTIGDVYRAALPYVGCALLTLALVIAFPQVALWLPGLMR